MYRNSLLQDYLNRGMKIGTGAYRNLASERIPSQEATGDVLAGIESVPSELTSAEINRRLKDPEAAKAILQHTDPAAYKKLERKTDRMNVLERLGELSSFDEWSDDLVWAMKQLRDQETGKPTPLKGWLAQQAIPLRYLYSGGRKLAGAVTGSKKVSDYDSPRGRDIIPQMAANIMMDFNKGKELAAEKGGALDYTDFDTMLDAVATGVPAVDKYNKFMAKLGIGVMGMAADTVGTPSMWVSGAGAAAKKAAESGQSVIKTGLAGKDFAELGAKQATKIATDGLTAAGVKVTKKNIEAVIESSSVLKDLTKSATAKGLYLTGPYTKGATPIKLGKKADIVARYIDNPLLAAFSDAYGVISKIPVEIAKGDKNVATIGSTVDDILGAVKKKLQPGYVLKTAKYGGSEELYETQRNLRLGLVSAEGHTVYRAKEVEAVLNRLQKAGDLPQFSKPEELLRFKEALTGNLDRTELGVFIDNLPKVTDTQKGKFWKELEKAQEVLDAKKVTKSEIPKHLQKEFSAANELFNSDALEDMYYQGFREKGYTGEEASSLAEAAARGARESRLKQDAKMMDSVKKGVRSDSSKVAAEIKAVASAGNDSAIAEYAVKDPTNFQRIMRNEIELEAIKKQWLESTRKGIEDEMATDWIMKNKTSGDFTKKAFKSKFKKGETWLTTYRPKNWNKLKKEALKNIAPAEIEVRLEQVLKRNFPGAKPRDLMGSKIDLIESFLFDSDRIKGLDIDVASRIEDYKDGNFIGELANEISDMFGYVKDTEYLTEYDWSYSDVASSLLDMMRGASGYELEHLQDLYVANSMIEEFGFTNLEGILADLSDIDENYLIDIVTKPYKVRGLPSKVKGKTVKGVLEKKLTSMGEGYVGKSVDARTPFEKYLEKVKGRDAQELILQSRQKARGALARKIYESQIASGGDKVKAAYEAHDVIDGAMKLGGKASPVTSIEEEVIAMALGRNTPVMEIDTEALEGLLAETKIPKASRNRILKAVITYQQEVADSKEFVSDFAGWLQKSSLPGHQKEVIYKLLNNIQSNYNADLLDPGQRKKVFRDLRQLEKVIADMGKFDADSSIMADYFQKVLINPMREHAETYTLRERLGFKNIGVYGVGSKTMDVSFEGNPDFDTISKLSKRERKIFNDATMAAYNEVLGEEKYKTLDRTETFVHDALGKQTLQSARLAAINRNNISLMQDIKEGKLGDGVKLVKGGEDLTGWSKLKVPGLENVYAKPEIAREFNSLTNWYYKEDVGEAVKTLRAFNDVWKGVQTGGGVNVPKVRGKAYDRAVEMGLGKFVDYFNEHLAYLPFSHGFTSRNILGNYSAALLATDMTTADIAEYLNKASGVQKKYLDLLNTPEYSQGLYGALMGTLDDKYNTRMAMEILDSGMLGMSYKASEYPGAAIEAAKGPVGAIWNKLSENVIHSRSGDYNENMENLWKSAIFLFERDRGASVEDALKSTQKALFDYSDVTSFERDVIKPITVFWTWSKKNLELMADVAQNKPQDFWLYTKLLMQPERQFGDRESREALPEWTRDLIGVPTKLGQDTAFLSGWGGNLEAASEWFGGPGETLMKGLDMLAPTYKIPLNLALGTHTYRGGKIEDDTSAYRYRALPSPLRKLLGIKEKQWTDRYGNTGSTYTMNPYFKYALEGGLGRLSTVPARWATVATGKESRLEGVLDLMLGYKTSRYDTDYLKYKSEKEDYEEIMKKLEGLGIVTEYSGYGYNTSGAKLNHPGLEDYLRTL